MLWKFVRHEDDPAIDAQGGVAELALKLIAFGFFGAEGGLVKPDRPQPITDGQIRRDSVAGGGLGHGACSTG